MSMALVPVPNGLAIQGMPGIAEGMMEGPPDLLRALVSGDALPPASCYEQPLRIALQFEGAGGARYPLWAFWLRTDDTWGAGFTPLREWRAQLPPPQRAHPLLVMARSQGRWDLEERFSLEFTQLMQEKDPLGIPDGRMMVRADTAAVPLHEALHTSIRSLLDSMRPASREPLPENCLVLRSGYRAVDWNLPCPAAVVARLRGEGAAARSLRGATGRIPLSPDPRVRARWKGPLLWGAWKSGGGGQRFLTLGYRGGDALHGELTVQAGEGDETQEQFSRCLTDFLNGEAIARAESDAALSRCMRTLTRNLEGDPEIRRALETPYAVLLRGGIPESLRLFEAASMPSPEPLKPSHGKLAGEDLRAELQRPRDVPVVLSRPGADGNGFPLRRPA
ncbi:MAG: hypothetical protein KJZ70_03660 [Bryobacterales bacterium]|nr:hypothetical protein [Bryobacterales bacterium]